jgi:hypothetical protein
MEQKKVEFDFDGSKLEAIRLYLKERGCILDHELDLFMDSLYKKYVPRGVREFIEMKEAEALQEATTGQSNRRRKPADGVSPGDEETQN